jgi:hypothetical protein
MATPQIDIRSEDLIKVVRRKKLLPWWIKVFMWIFLVMGIFIIPALVAAFIGFHFQVSLYGLETNDLNSMIGLVICSLILLKGIVCYGLWKEQSWATSLGILDASIGIIVCTFVMIYPPGTGFSLEIIFLIIYLNKLIKINSEWKTATGN